MPLPRGFRHRRICYASHSVKEQFEGALSKDDSVLVKKYLLVLPYGVHTYTYPTIGLSAKGKRITLVCESVRGKLFVREVREIGAFKGIFQTLLRYTRVIADLFSISKWFS
jgi:hypothetical protein